MARAEVWVEDVVAPAGRWVWIGGYEGDGGVTTVYATAAGTSTTVGHVLIPGEVNYLSLPGVPGAVATVPDEAAFDLSESHKVRMRMRKASWIAASNQVIISKWGTVGNYSWFWRLQGDGMPYYQKSPDGTATTGSPIPPAPLTPTAADTIVWVQFELFAADSHVVMSTHPDQEAEPTTGWTAVSTGAAGSALGTVYSGTAPLTIGSIVGATYQNLEADIFQICIRNAADALVFKLDPNNWTTGLTWVTSTGQTVTLAGTATIGSENA